MSRPKMALGLIAEYYAFTIIIHVDQVDFRYKEVWGLGLRPNKYGTWY